MKYHQLTRLFIPDSLKKDLIDWINMPDIHYLLNVMRKKPGQQLLVFNADDGEYLAEIINISHKKLSLKIIEQIRNPEKTLKINLIFAPIKQTRIGFLLEKSTELGVTELTPIQTKHSVVDKVNLGKWQIYVKEAAEQCLRLSLPKINTLQSLEQFLSNWPEDKIIIMCNEKEQNLSLTQYLKTTDPTQDINIMIGPEGGFSEQEINILLKKKFIVSTHLGERILRAETAALASLAMIQGNIL